MSTFIALSLCFTLIGFLLWLKPNTTKGKRLPGPFPFPIVGNLLQISYQSHVTFTKWAKRYGSIYSIKLGFKTAVILNDHKLIKELFNEPAASGRMQNNLVMLEMAQGPYGVMNSNGQTWEAQRKFTTKTLRSLGFAKESMETLILDEVKIVLDWFRKQKGSPISGIRIFIFPVINSLLRIITGKRLAWEDGKPAITDVMENFLNELLNVTFNGVFFAPWLKSIAPNYFGWNRYVKSNNAVLKFFQESIASHKETFKSTDLRDFIDHYLLQIENETDPQSSFYKDTGNANLLATHYDLYFLGSESSSTMLSWILLYLSKHQNIQRSLQNEIDQILGSNVPSLSNRVNMPYCEAMISEILRIISPTPLGAPHGMLSDLVFHGYHIPKGATVFTNLYAVHNDPEIWSDPETFRPERFLNEDKTKFVRNEALIPFSDGRRKCIGDTFALDSLFLFVTSIFQNFSVSFDPNSKEKVDLEPEIGMIFVPKPFKIVLTSRK